MTKWTTANIPDQTGRTVVITGANTGLGYETAAALAAKNAHVVLAVRNLDKGKDAVDRIRQATPDADVAPPENRYRRRAGRRRRGVRSCRTRLRRTPPPRARAGCRRWPPSTSKVVRRDRRVPAAARPTAADRAQRPHHLL